MDDNALDLNDAVAVLERTPAALAALPLVRGSWYAEGPAGGSE